MGAGLGGIANARLEVREGGKPSSVVGDVDVRDVGPNPICTVCVSGGSHNGSRWNGLVGEVEGERSERAGKVC